MLRKTEMPSVSKLVAGAALTGLLLAGALPQSAAAQTGQQGHMGVSGLEAVLAASADTPAEHKALAGHYRAKAEQARGEAETHRSMAKNYAGTLKPGIAAKQKRHCQQLVDLNDQSAKLYDEMAAAHEEAAGSQ
ncbi:MAG: hypothetical protein M5U32_11880 [Myxococcota bacterium]|nr:hypothetical protein [Myxococcota bacterium]